MVGLHFNTIMNDPQEPAQPLPESATQYQSSINTQLMWAVLFPLIAFGLVALLVVTSTINRFSQDLILQRDTAQVQLIANSISQDFQSDLDPTGADLNMYLQSSLSDCQCELYLVDTMGNMIVSSMTGLLEIPIERNTLSGLLLGESPSSITITSTATGKESVASIAKLDGKADLRLVIISPIKDNVTSAFLYQPVLAGLFIIGVIFTLIMLSASIKRITRPISMIAENANKAIPGSTFYPIPVQGPLEIRSLIRAYNHMVIRLAEQHTMLQKYAHQALLSQEEERQRLSHELHDGTVQDLIALSQRVELCRKEMSGDPESTRRRLEELQKLISQTIDDVRRISNALRPPILEDLGLSTALGSLCDGFATNNPNMSCIFEAKGTEHQLPSDVELVIYRVVQEALMNIQKHVPDARNIRVSLVFDEKEIITFIRNDGRNFTNKDIRSLLQSGHLGVAGMYERAKFLGGSLKINSDKDDGTVVELNIPYE
jgi:signal transduction histidine kinase